MHRYRIVTVAAIMLTTGILCLGLNPLIPDVAADEDCPPWAVIDRFGEHGLDIRLRDWWHSRPLSDACRGLGICVSSSGSWTKVSISMRRPGPARQP